MRKYIYKEPKHHVGDKVWYSSQKGRDQEGTVRVVTTEWEKGEDGAWYSKHKYSISEFGATYRRHVYTEAIFHNYTQEEIDGKMGD
ncbi:MAG TPA: hypothetical protein VK031_06650 [Tissierellaceae bacterium]|nr:hypothetical protein [Tissierellaceae bacterium]